MLHLLKRLLTLLVTMGVVSFLAFLAFSMISGDVATTMLGTQATPEALDALRTELGLNRPFLVRYGSWLLGFFTGDLGTSYVYHQSVTSLLAGKLSLTIELCLLSFGIIVVATVPLTLWSVRWEGRQGFFWKTIRGIDTVLTQFFMAIPSFFIGMVITWVCSIMLHWFVAGDLPDKSQDPLAFYHYLMFPAITLAIPRIAMTVRMLRSTILREMNQDYVRTAIARGASRSRVLYRHVLRNAMPPVVSFLAQTMAELVAAGIVVEQVFALPGLGRMLLSSIGNRDFPVVQAIVVILAFWVVASGTVADMVNSYIDPRLRLGGQRE